MKIRRLLFLKGLFVLGLFVLWSCNRKPEFYVFEGTNYLNHNDTVKYIGSEACKECHIENYTTYMITGMGMSFDKSSKMKSSSVLGPDSIIYDPYKDLYYHPYWAGDTLLMIMEYRLKDGDTIHKRVEYVDFIVGSGQHTNSHIFVTNGYAHQIPFTFYTQKGILDFPPGFEDGYNGRFERSTGLECISCHNGYPDLVLGSENKYTHIPQGIDCERCHGPGEVHAKFAEEEKIVDTSKHIDYAIVTPSKLTKKLANDICARCHLQGTMVLKEGVDFYTWLPGMPLEEYMEIFMPVFEGGKEDFIMASHYERFTQSRCFLESDGDYSCIECHNPHITHKATPQEKYNKTCLNCHKTNVNYCTESIAARKKENDNCVVCHMRQSGSRDIPHVLTHDHKISTPPTPEELKTERLFKGLVASNNIVSDSFTIARGYIREFETYHPDLQYLDSAEIYLKLDEEPYSPFKFNTVVNYYFLRKDHQSIRGLTEKYRISTVLNEFLTEIEFNNFDAWTAYRIGQAYENHNETTTAKLFYEKAVNLAKYNLEFQNKYGSILTVQGKLLQAQKIFEFIVNEDPNYASAHVNLGYVSLLLGRTDLAKQEYDIALHLNPDHLMGLMNMAGLNMYLGNDMEARHYIDRTLVVDPENPQAIEMKKNL